MITPTISIITPVKNGITFFKECLLSVLSQEGKFKIEYIVVDGMSDDGSFELAEFYRKNQPALVCEGIEMKLVRNKDSSMYEALAKGLSLCNGDLIAYLNADDYYVPGAFQTVAEIFNKYPEVYWLCGKPLSVNADGMLHYSFLPFPYHSLLIQKGYYGFRLPFIQQENVFFRKELISQIDLTKLSIYKLAGDFYMWQAISRKYRLFICTSHFTAARIHPDQLSKDNSGYEREYMTIAEKKSLYTGLLFGIHYFLNFIVPDKLKMKLSDYYISGGH